MLTLSMLQHGQISKLSLCALQLLDQKNRNTTTRRILEKKSSPHMINRSLHVLYTNPSECLFQPPPTQMSGSVVPSHDLLFQPSPTQMSGSVVPYQNNILRRSPRQNNILFIRTQIHTASFLAGGQTLHIHHTPPSSSLADKRSLALVA